MKRIVFLLIVFSSHIFAQNLLNNPHFDTDTLDIDWPDGNGKLPRSSVIAIKRDDNGLIG